ncbi:multidrug effflux MFS transporter [Selenomonas caprae]|uniref:Bcr/CflA family efflux transporter n=1 Tax=Selenomonas caprae TaxID=2606905 RepID=A0A5D6WR08_9FIRM|nr:multidrug effflux MFS transporter [Selenomonas caprae]TYZ29752.1 multidrug effflux MFS transporter [Selenomonas caprae]
MQMTNKTRLWLTVFLGIMSAMAPLSTDMYLPALPTVQTDLGISASLAQLTLTMTIIGMAIGQIFTGPLSDRYGRRGPLFIGMILFILATAGCVWAQDIRLFLLCRFLAGFAGASGIVIARAIARDVCEGAELTRFFALLMMVNGLAPIIAPVLGGQILLFTSWRGVFVVLVFIGILQALATLAYKETLPKEQRLKGLSESFRKYPQLLRDRYFLGHCLLQCFVFGAFFSYLAGSSFVFQNIYQVSPQTFSLIFGFIGLGLMLAGLLPARLAGRVPDEKLLKAGVLLPLAGSLFLLVGFVLDAPIGYTVAVLFVTVVPLSVMGSASFSLALSRQGQNAGSASALVGFFSMILGACMMPVVGIMGDHTAIPMSLLMVAGYGLGVLCFYTMIVPEHK